MNKKAGIISALAIIIVGLAACLGLVLNKTSKNTVISQAKVTQKNKQKTIKKIKIGLPTIFIHGYGSSYHAEEHMVNAAVQAGVTNSKNVIRADVASSGQVKLIGSFSKDAKNPIVEVNLEQGYGDAQDVRNVLEALQNKYSFKEVNLVGHSYGNLMVANYINDNYQIKTLPTINKVVSIAGHYNGWLGEEEASTSPIKNKKTGEPEKFSSSFKQLLTLRQHYPKQIQVLNMYGDLEDGSKSDGSVAVSSAQSYKYLINGRAKSYREIEFTGKNAQHSRLHRNSQVDKALIEFLWNK
ncbi:alpha/beta hydrolase [Lactobacillus sp. LL6]|uniref:alpha/beta hydrolase n=1 Tax=Lactobacillus sp. LL6 TaxID=2596827 RepID=UPI0011866C06|nr:alpha/beta hydrolase [Lactobacillus sp. LL6]TSO26606.1 alpha/beta hydrolase [Lactobacillus sp. LL6]